MRRVPRPKSALSQRLSYRLDRFLSLHPMLQLGAVLLSATFLAALFGALFLLVTDDKAGIATSVWWSMTHMLDGGTVAADNGVGARLLGVGVTLVGMVLVAVITGAFASSFADRLRELRRGTLPVFERGHVLILGYSARTEVVLRELCASGVVITVVVVTRATRAIAEERARAVMSSLSHGVRLIVRHAEPGTTVGVRGASAEHARAVVILPDVGLAEAEGESGAPADADLRETPDSSEEPRGSQPDLADGDSAPVRALSTADRNALRALLAVRRVLGSKRTPVLIELDSDAGRPLVRLCAHAGDVALMEDGRLGGHLLSHAVRQPGVIDVVRQILSLDARSVYVHTAGLFQGKVFERAHAELGPGLLIGVVRGGRPILCPAPGFHIEAQDKLLVFADDATEPRPIHKASSGDLRDPPRSSLGRAPLSVLVVGLRTRLAVGLVAMYRHGVTRITWLVPPGEIATAERLIAESSVPRSIFTLIEGTPMHASALRRAVLSSPDRLLLLAAEHFEGDPAEADADQILALLQLRRVLAAASRPDVPSVVEVHTASSEQLLPPRDDTEVVLLREISGLFLAQQLHAICLDETAGAWLGDMLRRILYEMTTRLWLRPLKQYVEEVGAPRWADVLLAARSRGEIAIGVKRRGGRAELLPDPSAHVDPRDAYAVVLGEHAAEEPDPISA